MDTKNLKKEVILKNSQNHPQEDSGYDKNNVFAKILRQEIPCKKIVETEHVLVFADLYPKAPIHVLCIPKGSYKHFSDFQEKATPQEQLEFWKVVADVVKNTGMSQSGFRLISNQGHGGGQEVPHFHVHVMGGEGVESFPLFEDEDQNQGQG